ncbi:MAG: metallophosphoesterase [Clostridia bacterium]|nr:metallophosphoesterase [Clostridia bacterium]
MKNTKTKIIAFIMSVVMILAIIPVSVFAAGKDDISIATLSDAHYYADSLKGNRTEDYQALVKGSTTTLDLTAACFDAALITLEKELKKANNPYLILPGDLTYQGEYESHIEIAGKLEKWEKKTGIDVIVINGNHDVNNAKAYSFVNDKKEAAQQTTQEDFREIYKNLGYDIAYHTYTPPAGKQQGGLSYSVRLDEGYRLLILDTNIYSSDCTKDGSDEHETRQAISDDLLEWALAECADAKAKGEEIIGISHSSMIDHIGSYQEKLLGAYIVEGWEDRVTALTDAGLHFNFCGHQHLADVATYVTDNGETLYECESPPVGTYPCGMYITEFENDGDGKVSATYNYHDVDEVQPVNLYGKEMAQPIKNYAFGQAYGNGDVTTLAMNIIKYNLGSVFEGISTAGGILEYLEQEGIDLEQILSDAFAGLTLGPIDIFTAENIMFLADDLCDQLYDTYLTDVNVLYDLMERIIDKVVNIQVTDVPCTKFIDTLGFGDPTRGGNFGELALSFLAYMYGGNENLADDAFMQDCFKQMKDDTVFAETLFNSLLDIILNDLLLDELLANMELNVDEAFPFGKIGFCLGKIVDALLTVILGGDKSLTHIVEFVFNLGVLPWDSLDGLRNELLGEYLTVSQYEAIGIEFATVIGAFIDDKNPKVQGDKNVTYTYSGKVEPEVTQANYRAPSIITVTYGEDSSSSFNISWYTKDSVKGTDIELLPYSENPKFTGTPTVSDNIECITEEDVIRETPAIDFGIIGISPLEKEMTRHIVKLTNLEPGTKYCYRIGDAERGWWSETGVLETADNTRAFTFLHVTDTQAQNSKQFDVWANLLRVAGKEVPDYKFLLSTGDQVDMGSNLKLWTLFANNASDTLMNKPLMPTAGNHENMSGSVYALDENFALPSAPEQDRSEGVYYSFDYNNAHFAVLNANNLGEDEGFNAEQIEWLREDMTSSDAEWKFVATHKAIYSNGSHFDDDDVIAMREQLSTLMPELDIDMVFQGHDHVYMRTDAMANNKVVAPETEEITFSGKDYSAKIDPQGTVYTITGCAGVKYYLPKDNALTDELFPRAEAIVTCELPTFASINIQGNKLFFDAYNVDGDEAIGIDSFAIVKTDLEEYVAPEKDEATDNADEIETEIEETIEDIANNISEAVETGDIVPYVAFIILPVALAAAVVTYKKRKKADQE